MNTARMKILAEEVLILMLYGVDLLSSRSTRKWNQSYEGWLYENGFLRRVHYLEKQKFLLREGKRGDWIVKLTQAGRQLALGGRDAEALWQRGWDGWWRQIAFDLPLAQHRTRSTLIRWLRRNGFGYLQDSVWISPNPVTEVSSSLKSVRDDAESFTILECRVAPGFNNSSLVSGAWPFKKINNAYVVYQRFADSVERRLRRERLHPRELFDLLRSERKTWAAAFDLDPLLPMPLWPKNYEGHR